MGIREYIALLEQRAEYEAAELLSEPVSEEFVLPVKMVLNQKKAADRDFAVP